MAKMRASLPLLLTLLVLPQLDAAPALRYEQPPTFLENSDYTSASGARARGRWVWPSFIVAETPDGSMRGLYAAGAVSPGLLLPYVGELGNLHKRGHRPASYLSLDASYTYVLANGATNLRSDGDPALPLCRQQYCAAAFVNEASGAQLYNARYWCPTPAEARVLAHAPAYHSWEPRGCFILVMSELQVGEEVLMHYGDGYPRAGYTAHPGSAVADAAQWAATEAALQAAVAAGAPLGAEWLHPPVAPVVAQQAWRVDGSDEWVDAWFLRCVEGGVELEVARAPGLPLVVTHALLAGEGEYFREVAGGCEACRACSRQGSSRTEL